VDGFGVLCGRIWGVMWTDLGLLCGRIWGVILTIFFLSLILCLAILNMVDD